MEGRWASLRPSKAWFRGKCGSVCRVLFVDFWPSPWSLNDALGCRGVFEARSTLWSHRRPFGASLGGRWASPRPLEVWFKGKSVGVGGVRLSSFRPSSWSLADALGYRGVSQACHTLWTHCRPFDSSLKGRWTSLRPLEVRFKGKSGGVCGVRLSPFQP